MAAFSGADMMDITGPLEVFSAANEVLRRAGKKPLYTLHIAAEKAGPCRTAAGLKIYADTSWHDWQGSADTLLVAGGPGYERFPDNAELVGWIKKMSGSVRRVASVCTGAFFLAEAGLLNGRSAATHWMAAGELASRYPLVRVEPDVIYTGGDGVYCSAGVTSGIDMSLSFVMDDTDRQTALDTARLLVMFLKRPGGQTQFSKRLEAQFSGTGRFAELLKWLDGNYSGRTRVETLAEMCAMSPRNFARCFLLETGSTPARYVENLRLDRSLELMEENGLGLEEIALMCGFTGGEQFRRAFARRFAVTPAEYRERFY